MLDHAGEEAVLPDTARLHHFPVEILGIDLVGQSDPARKRGFILRHGEQMEVVVHQTIGPNLQVILLCIVRQKFEIGLPVFIVEEDRSAIIAALRNVMRIAGGYDARDSWHGGRISRGRG